MQPSVQDVSVANAEQLLARFLRERDELIARKSTLADRRRYHAYAAHSGDAKANKLLDGVNREAVELETKLASIDAAVSEAKHRVEIAKQHEARAADRAQALAICQEWTESAADFAALDQGLNLAADAACRLYERYGKMQQHGFKPPPQLTLMLADVVVSALMAMPKPLWQQFNYQGLEYLPPGRRRSAASLRGAWGPQVERHVQQQLGDEPTNNEAA
jgi:hypothetical protein